MNRLLLMTSIVAAGCFAQDEGLGWLDNYQDALKAARATGKPIFLEYRCEP